MSDRPTSVLQATAAWIQRQHTYPLVPRYASMKSDLIPVKTFSFRPDAEHAQQLLEASGVSSVVSGDDASGWAPHLGFAAGGIALLVDRNDMEKATKVLESPDQH